jgi:hypothetical protein
VQADHLRSRGRVSPGRLRVCGCTGVAGGQTGLPQGLPGILYGSGGGTCRSAFVFLPGGSLTVRQRDGGIINGQAEGHAGPPLCSCQGDH